MTVARISSGDEEEIPQELNPVFTKLSKSKTIHLDFPKSCPHSCAVVNEKNHLSLQHILNNYRSLPALLGNHIF